MSDKVKVGILELNGEELSLLTEKLLESSIIDHDPSNTDLISTDLKAATKELADRHFGKDQGFNQDLGSVSITSGTFISVLSLGFDVNATIDGTYRFAWSSITFGSKPNTVGEIRLVIDPGLPTEIILAEGSILNLQRIFTGFDSGLLDNGSYTVELQARRTAGNGTVDVSKMRIEEWRVS